MIGWNCTSSSPWRRPRSRSSSLARGIGGDGAGRGAVGLDAVAAEALGVVHGELGVAQHVVGGRRVAVVDGDADRGGERQVALAEVEGRLQRLADLLGGFGDLAGGGFGGEDHARTGRRDRRATVSSGRMTRAMRREMASSTESAAEWPTRSSRSMKRSMSTRNTAGLMPLGSLARVSAALEPIEEELLVGQAREAVVHGIVQQAVAAGAVFVDVLQGADDAGDLAVAAQHRLYAHAEGAVVAVVGGEADVGRDLAAAQFDQRVERGAEAVAVVGVDAVEPALDGAA